LFKIVYRIKSKLAQREKRKIEGGLQQEANKKPPNQKAN
jgi:hypothetical protein